MREVREGKRGGRIDDRVEKFACFGFKCQQESHFDEKNREKIDTHES